VWRSIASYRERWAIRRLTGFPVFWTLARAYGKGFTGGGAAVLTGFRRLTMTLPQADYPNRSMKTACFRKS